MEVLYALERLRTGWLDTLMSGVTQLGGAAVFLAVSLIVLWCVSRRHGMYLLFTGFLGALVGQLLKLCFHIPRPWVLDPGFTIVERARAAATGYSFPSGHTINAAATFGCVARWTRRRLLRWVCILLIVLIAFSRMYLGVHTPLDVAVGLIVGLALVFALYPFFERYGGEPVALRAALWALLGVTAAVTAFILLRTWPAQMDAENLTEGIENAWLLLGAAVGLLLAGLLQRRADFPVHAPFWAQILKLVLGLALTYAVMEGLRFVLGFLPVPGGPARALRYGAAAFFVTGVWPRTFPWFSRGCRRK